MKKRRKLKKRAKIRLTIVYILLLSVIIAASYGIYSLFNTFFFSVKNLNYNELNNNEINSQTEKKTIILDAGHGYKDAGTIYPPNEIKNPELMEKIITLDITLKAKNYLEQLGYTVVLTRDSDSDDRESDKITLKDRVNMAKRINPDFFVSIHCDYFEDSPQISGARVYYTDTKDEFSNNLATLANTFATTMEEGLGQSDVGVYSVKKGDLAVTTFRDFPSVLLEIGFLSNITDRENMKSETWKDLCAKSVANAVLNTIGK